MDTPTSVITDVGSNVTLTCTVDCFCPGAVLTWKRGINSTLPDNAQVSLKPHYYYYVVSITTVCIGKE